MHGHNYPDFGIRIMKHQVIYPTPGDSVIITRREADRMDNNAGNTEILVYYFPQYHPDARNDKARGKGWTEWELVKAAKPRFPGHRQPKVPAWGYFDESDPDWAAKEIALAADHGVTGFLFDWYYYEDGPFLQDALERGFLKAPNCDRLKFALMWANHDWEDIHPDGLARPRKILFPGRVSVAGFERVTRHVIRDFFTKPNHLTVGGEPFFSIFDVGTFISGLGGLDGARKALARFRADTRAAGFPGLHLNAITWKDIVLGDGKKSHFQAVEEMGFSSAGNYTWIQNYEMKEFPIDDYHLMAEAMYVHWEDQRRGYKVPFFPNVTMGWDSSPRTDQTEEFKNRGYPWIPVLGGNTPEAFRGALQRAKAFVNTLPAGQRLVTINAWNEWTEGSYLLPDTEQGKAYLEAIGKIFGK